MLAPAARTTFQHKGWEDGRDVYLIAPNLFSIWICTMRAGNTLGLSSHSFPAKRLPKSLRKSRFQRLLKAAYKHKWCIQTTLRLVAWHSPHLTGPIDEILQGVLVAKSGGGRLISKKGGLGWENKQKSRLAIYCTVVFWLMICLLHHIIIFRF